MGNPRAKKKTNVILSSDEEDGPKSSSAKPKAAAKPQKTAAAKKKTSSVTSTPKKKGSTKNGVNTPGSQRSQPSPSSAHKTKPIYSFFNAATQRQTAPAFSSTNGASQKPVVKQEDSMDIEEEDLIEDDSLDEELANLSDTKFGSKYPIPVRRKRKINDVEGDGMDSSSLPRASQMFKRAAISVNGHVSQSSAMKDQRPWTERFAPVTVDELAVHKKKVQDVKSWLQTAASGSDRKRLLILKGAAGTGKTTTVNLVSQQLGSQVNEWRTAGITSSEEGFVSMSAQFEDFVSRTGTFGTLDLGGEPARHADEDRRQLVLVEEFPNTFSRSSSGLQSFRKAVLHYLEAATPSLNSLFASKASSKPVTPVVMIISESLLSTSTAASDSFTAYRLLGPDILAHAGTTVIEFNPIAPTFMTKALDQILQKESKVSGRRKAPGTSVLKHLAEIGDIRSAVSSLEFLCLRGDESAEWTGKVTSAKQKRGAKDAPLSKMETDSLELITQRESTLGIFHAVGKVVYNKRETPAATDTPPPQPPHFLPQHARPKVSEVNTETLLNELGTDISTFNAALHENYVLSCGGLDAEETLDHINGCIDALSDGDILAPDRFSSNRFAQTYSGTGTDSLRQDEISFQASVRGLLFSLPHPVKRIAPPSTNSGKSNGFGGKAASFQMFYPASMRLWRKQEELEESLDKVLSKLRNQTPSSKSRSDSAGSSGLPTMSAVEQWRVNRFSGRSAAPTIKPGFPGYGTQFNNKPAVKEEGEEDDESNPAALIRTVPKEQMLLERMPYLLRLSKRAVKYPKLKDLSKDFDRISRITGGASGLIGATEEQDDDAEGSGEGSTEQWSTDKPVEETTNRRSRFGIRKTSDQASGAMKDKMDSLVLEDDDIEDDEM